MSLWFMLMDRVNQRFLEHSSSSLSDDGVEQWQGGSW